MTLTCRLIARLLFVILLFVAAPFSVGGERVIAPDAAESTQAGAGPFDTQIDRDDAEGPSQQNAAGGEPPGTEPPGSEADAQECALLMDGVWRAARTPTAAVDLAHLPVPSPVLAALERPPRGR